MGKKKKIQLKAIISAQFAHMSLTWDPFLCSAWESRRCLISCTFTSGHIWLCLSIVCNYSQQQQRMTTALGWMVVFLFPLSSSCFEEKNRVGFRWWMHANHLISYLEYTFNVYTKIKGCFSCSASGFNHTYCTVFCGVYRVKQSFSFVLLIICT